MSTNQSLPAESTATNSKMKVRHILVQYEYEAKDLLKLLYDGKDFTTLAKKYSLCASAAGGGHLGTVTLSRLDQDFAEALVQLHDDEFSSPTKSKFGWHIIQKLK